MLKDLLAPDLDLVVCGTAAGTRSAAVGFYYAGVGNKFWPTLAATGLTPRRLAPREYALLLQFGVGLTDAVKGQAGADADLDFRRADPRALRRKVARFAPRYLCFNGKQAARIALERPDVHYGLQAERIGSTALFVAPSTSGAANAHWDITRWHELAHLIRSRCDA